MLCLHRGVISEMYETISKIGFWFPAKSAGPSSNQGGLNFNPEAPAGSALGVNTLVFRGVEMINRHRYWAKRQF